MQIETQLLELTKETPIYSAPTEQRALYTLQPGTKIRVYAGCRVGKRTQVEYGNGRAAWADLREQGQGGQHVG